MSHHATHRELRRYREHGYFLRERVLAEPQLAPLREAAEGVHERIVRDATGGGGGPVEWVDDKRYQKVAGSLVKWEWRDGSGQVRSMEPYHHLDGRLDALIDDPRLWQPACPLVSATSLSLFSDKLNYKRPGGSPFPWHQDSPYWAFGCDHLDRLVSVLIYLDDADVENGCLWVIPGSHTHGLLPTFQDRGVMGRLYTDLDVLPDLQTPVPLEAPAGSVVWFHGDLVHGSQGNRSDCPRRVLVLTYQPAGLPRWRHEDVRPVQPLAQ
jgi:hypothetical protein